jgi:glutamate racemase
LHAVTDPTSPILLFDSGVGGLTVLAELRRILPQAPVIYAADNAGRPYGAKSEAEVAARVVGLLGRMTERYSPRLVCIACNTASTIALEMVREVLEVPIVGTVPAIKPAAAITRSGVIGLLGTEATIRQAYIDRLEEEFVRGKKLVRHAAPELVEAAETKLRGGEVSGAAITAAVESLRSQPDGELIDTVVLACTHFPLLEAELASAFGSAVRLVHGAEGIARRIASLTEGQQFRRAWPDRVIFTGDTPDLVLYAPALARYGLESSEIFWR